MRPPRAPRKGDLVLVRWRDASGVLTRTAGQPDAADPAEHLEAETVGWISKRTRANLYVSSERLPPGYADQYRGTTRIPVGWIKDTIRIA
jgi:hypothetical protein